MNAKPIFADNIIVMLALDKRKYFLMKSIWENQKYSAHIPIVLTNVIQKYIELTHDPDLKHIEQEGVDTKKLITALSLS